MSRVRANKLTNRAGSGAPQLTYGAEVVVGYGITGAGGVNIAGVATAGGFVGNLTGNVTGNADTATTATTATSASGITGTPDISVKGLNSTGIATAVMFSGNVTGTAGTFSGNISAANITASNGVKVTGAGVTAAGVSTFHNDLHVAGVIEKVAAATTYQSGNDMVLELDVTNSTTYRYSMPSAGNIGIVSFKNMPADRENGTTVTVLFTQNSSTPTGGIGNTQVANGIGTHCTVAPFAGGSALTGLHTAGLVGSATTVTLSSTASDVDFVSFFVHYTGGTNTNLTSYKVYVTSNGNFRFGNVGI
jgi:hypothetical protein